MRAFLIIFCALLGMPQTLHAASDAYYWSLKTSLGASRIENISHGGTIGTGQAIGRDIDGLIKEPDTNDYTAGLGIAIGRRMASWQIESEVIWRYRTDWDVFAPTPSIGTITNVFSDVSTTTVLVNLSHRRSFSQRWSWEAGAGVGWAFTQIDADYIERGIPGVAPEQTFEADNNINDFSYTVFAGLVRQTSGSWTFNTQLRIIDLGNLSVGPFPDRAARLSARHRAITLTFGFEKDL